MRAAIMVLTALAVTGCSGGAMPWSSQTASGRGAVDHSDGIWVEAWPSRPINGVTPVLVRIDNRGPRTLAIRNSDIVLRTGDQDLAALPLLAPGTKPTTKINQPAYLAFGFSVAPHLAGVYPLVPPVNGPFDIDPNYYSSTYPTMVNSGGPTEEMLHQALPEGELVAGGKVKGYLYFPDSGQATSSSLRIRLIDAAMGQDFGSISVPVPLSP